MLDQSGPFALCVGTVEFRKNQAPLLKLWESLGEGSGPRLADARHRRRSGLARPRRAQPAPARRAQAPYLGSEAPTDRELAWLYGRAAFTVFPSLAEGWGLPIGESLWFGKPCVASDATSMPEVGGPLWLRQPQAL